MALTNARFICLPSAMIRVDDSTTFRKGHYRPMPFSFSFFIEKLKKRCVQFVPICRFLPRSISPCCRRRKSVRRRLKASQDIETVCWRQSTNSALHCARLGSALMSTSSSLGTEKKRERRDRDGGERITTRRRLEQIATLSTSTRMERKTTTLSFSFSLY